MTRPLPLMLAALALAASCTPKERAPEAVPAAREASLVDEDREEVTRDPAEVAWHDALQSARRLALAGDDAQAVLAFDALIASLPDGEKKDSARCELATVLNNRAPRSFTTDPRTADVDTKRAVELCPSDAQLVRNRARFLVARAAKEDRGASDGRARARAWLEESIALYDGDADAHVLLAEILVVDDELRAAADHLEKATALRPEDASLAARHAEIEKKAAVEGGFQGARQQHFIARFEGYAQERLSWTALDLLEKAYFSVGNQLGVFPREPITVVIYTGDQYKRVVDVPDWSAGVFDGKIRVREGSLLASQGHLESLLRHEYTHAALATLPTRLPAWLNEGLARVMEGDDLDRERRVFDEAARAGRLLPWETLSAPSFVTIQDPERARLAYATAATLVRSLVDKRGAWALQTFVSRLAAGEALDDAFRATWATTPRAAYDGL